MSFKRVDEFPKLVGKMTCIFMKSIHEGHKILKQNFK